MAKDNRDLLDVLKFELKVLELGGYGSSARTMAPAFGFRGFAKLHELRLESKSRPVRRVCPDTAGAPDQRGQKTPCRHIPLTKEGETLDYLYRCGTQQEIEDATRTWLRAIIQRLEAERAQDRAVRA